MLYKFSVNELQACSLISVPHCTNISLWSSRTLVVPENLISQNMQQVLIKHSEERLVSFKIANETSTYEAYFLI